jgi:hypothetical protein
MEPGFNPALEYQAIGRVHRLGQKREVEVVRLLVKDSVETRIRDFLAYKYGSAPGDSCEENGEVAIGPVGNQATERPKSAIIAAEFDILFGVHGEGLATYGLSDDEDEDMPDAPPSSGII